jgi:hypothetical protein
LLVKKYQCRAIKYQYPLHLRLKIRSGKKSLRLCEPLIRAFAGNTFARTQETFIFAPCRTISSGI